MNRQLTNLLSILLLLPIFILAGCGGSTQPSSSTATAASPTSAPASTPATDTEALGPLPVPTFDGTPGAVTGPTIGSADPPGSPITPPTPSGAVIDGSNSALPSPPGETAPTPTPVIARGTGDAITALQALEQLKPKALIWQNDARLGLLSNIRPGQEKNLLGTTLGDPNVNEHTPGGLGRNWTLVAFSPSTRGAIAISADGSQVDLVKEGAITQEAIARFNSPHLASLNLSTLNSSQLVDSDALFAMMGELGKSKSMGIALLAPDGLGLGPLPTPFPTGDSPQLAYEAFSTDPNRQTFIFFDAKTGNIVLDNTGP